MPEDWEFSNYCDVIGAREGKLCDFSSVLTGFANNVAVYHEFVLVLLTDAWAPRLMRRVRTSEEKQRKKK